MTSIFADVIQDHLKLKEQNADLDPVLPLDRYKGIDPFENHPLFKTEEQARIEDTLDGTAPIGLDERELVAVPAHSYSVGEPAQGEGLWSRSRDFDWGD